jgi:Holliday junction resolvase
MTHYNKGANAERELIAFLAEKGFAVLRVAGSGVSRIPSPDAVALKSGRVIAFECKAWKGTHLAIDNVAIVEEYNWAQKAGAEFYVAWKMPRKGWWFLEKSQFHESPKFHIISAKKAELEGIRIEKILEKIIQKTENKQES